MALVARKGSTLSHAAHIGRVLQTHSLSYVEMPVTVVGWNLAHHPDGQSHIFVNHQHS